MANPKTESRDKKKKSDPKRPSAHFASLSPFVYMRNPLHTTTTDTCDRSESTFFPPAPQLSYFTSGQSQTAFFNFGVRNNWFSGQLGTTTHSLPFWLSLLHYVHLACGGLMGYIDTAFFSLIFPSITVGVGGNLEKEVGIRRERQV